MRVITRKIWGMCIGFAMAMVIGCSDYVIKNPIKHFNLEDLFEKSVLNRGTSLSLYMTRYALLKKWGYPDERKLIGETNLGAPIERWTYYAWIPGFPISYRYVAKEYRLYFHGEILMRWEDTDLLKRGPKAMESKRKLNKEKTASN